MMAARCTNHAPVYILITTVEEYCISESWIKVQAGKARDRKGNPLLIKLSGPVEAWFEDLGDDAPVAKL